jgi:hypothetical protein
MMSVKNLETAIRPYVQHIRNGFACAPYVRLQAEKSLTVDCHVIDVREAYGRVDVLITPVSGSGEQWVSTVRLILNNIV